MRGSTRLSLTWAGTPVGSIELHANGKVQAGSFLELLAIETDDEQEVLLGFWVGKSMDREIDLSRPVVVTAKTGRLDREVRHVDVRVVADGPLAYGALRLSGPIGESRVRLHRLQGHFGSVEFLGTRGESFLRLGDASGEVYLRSGGRFSGRIVEGHLAFRGPSGKFGFIGPDEFLFRWHEQTRKPQAESESESSWSDAIAALNLFVLKPEAESIGLRIGPFLVPMDTLHLARHVGPTARRPMPAPAARYGSPPLPPKRWHGEPDEAPKPAARYGSPPLPPKRWHGEPDEAPKVPVMLGASAPKRVRPGDEFSARFAAYHPGIARIARRALKQGRSSIHTDLAEAAWRIGARVLVRLTGEHLSIIPASQEFVWDGRLCIVDFDVRVHNVSPTIVTKTRLRFEVFLPDIPELAEVAVARPRLDLKIDGRKGWLERLFSPRLAVVAEAAFQRGYASYHHADRHAVLTRLDAIQQHAGLTFFYDCFSMDPREERKPILEAEIVKSDLFFLFWSPSAARSSEVDWEWKTALDRKGGDAVEAQRLPGPAQPPLPVELQALPRPAVNQNLAALVASDAPPALMSKSSSGSPISAQPAEVPVVSKSRILFLAANPAPTKQLALGEEARDIEMKIRASAHRDAFEIKHRLAVRTDDLLQALNEDRPVVVHFSGHGSGTAGIILHDEGGGHRLVNGSALKRLFGAIRDNIQVVVLNACFSLEQAKAIVEVIDCVVGMKDSIGDEAARRFSAGFYRALGFGRSVRNAFDQGLAAIDLDGLGDEDVPVLMVREGVDANLIVLVEGVSDPT